MIKNKLQKTFLAVVLLSSSLMAESMYSNNTYSLVGLEGGYSSMDYERGTNLNNTQYKVNMPHAGLKVGAESEDFRVFLSGRYFYDSAKTYDYVTTYGAEVQYKFNVAKSLDFFIGANGGIANMKFRGTTSAGAQETFSRTIQSPYFGGDIGTNIRLSDSTVFELGGRVMSLQADNTKDATTYRIGNIVSVYASIIFRWKMN
jgi:hypothetical protein